MSVATLEYERPWMYDEQEAGIFCSERYACIEASTKSGKTIGCIAWILEQALQGRPGRNYWWVAPVYSQAEIAFRRLKESLPWEVRDMCHWVESSSLRVDIPNGTTIWFKSAEKPDNLYGEDVYAAVLDEATRMREEAWHAIRTTLTATRGPVRIIGNVKGRRNWAYKLARKAESGEPDMHYAKITWEMAAAARVIDPEEVEDARRQLPEQVFRELYMAEPSDDGGNPFGLDAIARQTMPAMPDSEPVCWGWDLAKSEDYTVGYGLDSDGRVCRMERFQRPWEETMDAILDRTGHCPALIDSTGVGDPIVEQLQRRGGSRFEGYKFTSESKQKLMEGLAVAVQQGKVWFPAGVTVNELEAFEYEYTRTGVKYSAPQGEHDDCACALALAWAKYNVPRGDLERVHRRESDLPGRGGDW